MPLTVSGISAGNLAELLREHLKYRTIENFCMSAPAPEAMKRRVFDILNGKCQMVTLKVADDICTVAGRPDWLSLL